ncbi:MAG: hypothetical protein J3K34DRAFT_520230 [Monoraphidium minutum]|nr:MAG: hypothetical protein J3K34DRAFT_520230 [Monoraphidium minutum]
MDKKTEDLGKKLKGFFRKVTNDINTSGSAFKGSGHRLGEQRIAAAAARGAGHRDAARLRPAAPKPEAVLLPASEFDPFQAAVGGGAALNANRDPPREAVAAASPTRGSGGGVSGGGGGGGGAGTSSGGSGGGAARPAPRGPPAAPEQVDEMRHCVALILSMPPDRAAGSVEVLSRLLGNLLSRPEEPKFRQLRLGNKRIREAVVDVPGACGLLAACGFAVHPDDGDAEEGGFAAFLEDEKLPLVEEGLLQLQSLAAAALGAGAGPAPAPAAAAAAPPAAPAAPAPAAAEAPAVDRRLRVILPVASDIRLDAAFFERTPADVRAEYARLSAARRAGEVFATRAAREAARGAARGPAPKEAAVRVRFPEGVQLEAFFGVKEPLVRVHEAVAASLRSPATPFELVAPDRAPLPRGGRVGDAGLAPAVLLNFRALQLEGGGGGGGLPALSDAMLACACVD